jgi:hypothetical protein
LKTGPLYGGPNGENDDELEDEPYPPSAPNCRSGCAFAALEDRDTNAEAPAVAY